MTSPALERPLLERGGDSLELLLLDVLEQLDVAQQLDKRAVDVGVALVVVRVGRKRMAGFYAEGLAACTRAVSSSTLPSAESRRCLQIA